MKLMNIVMYYLVFFIPSSTLFYVILHDYMGWDIATGYIVANLIGATIMLPVNKYIFGDNKLQ